MRDAPFYRMKAGAADLVRMAGGQARSGDIVGVSQQQVSKIVRRDDGAMFSLRAMLALEMDCGEPVLTRICAELQGFRLVRDDVLPGPLPANPYVALADLSAEYADAVSEFSRRTTDGVFSPADGAAMDRRLSELIDKAEDFRRYVAKQAAESAS